MAKSKVAVLKTSPETILEDTQRLMQLAGADFKRDVNDVNANEVIQ